MGAKVVGPDSLTSVVAFMYASLSAATPLKCGSWFDGTKGKTAYDFVHIHPNLKAGMIPSSSNLGISGSKTEIARMY